MSHKRQPAVEGVIPGQMNGNVTSIFGSENQSVVVVDDQATGRTILKSIISGISPRISCEVFSDPNPVSYTHLTLPTSDLV